MRLYIYLALGAAVLAAFGVIALKISKSATDSVLLKIEKGNSDVTNKANRGGMSWTECDRVGGVYDFTSSQCAVPDRGGR